MSKQMLRAMWTWIWVFPALAWLYCHRMAVLAINEPDAIFYYWQDRAWLCTLLVILFNAGGLAYYWFYLRNKP